jgi:hypothetical protein
MPTEWRWGIPILAGGVAALAAYHALSPGESAPPDLPPAVTYAQHPVTVPRDESASSALDTTPLADPKGEDRPAPGPITEIHPPSDPLPADNEAARLARVRAEGTARNLIALLRAAVRRKSEVDCLTLQAKLKQLDPSVRPVVKQEFEREKDPTLRGLLDEVLSTYGKK